MFFINFALRSRVDVHIKNEHLKIIPVMESGQFYNDTRIMASRSCFCSVYVLTIYIIEAWAIVYYLCQAVQSFITVIVNSFMLFLFVLGKTST